MEEKKQNEELQSRREFFKEAAKKALPIIGAIALASSPIIAKAAETEPMGCYHGCSGSCTTACGNDCTGSCSNTCSSCQWNCSSSCRNSCRGGCSESCFNTCSGGCVRQAYA